MNSKCAIASAVIIVAGMLSSCSQDTTLREKRPAFHPVSQTAAALGDVEKSIVRGLKSSKRDPRAAVADYLSAVDTASQRLAVAPDDVAARDCYNFAVARLLTTLQEARLEPWTRPLTLSAEHGGYVVTSRTEARKVWNPALYEFKPADQFDVGGNMIAERSQKQGLGAPMVAIGRELNPDAQRDYLPPRTFYGVTAVVRISGKQCEIAFEDPLATETVKMGGHTYPLAADFTVPLALMLASADVKELGLARLLDPGKYAHTARISRLQPYDPDKTVVLVVHGLNSSPATWTAMINTLRQNEEIRRNFQFWFYSYPSGYPYPRSAALLRKELDAVEKRYPLKKKMVVIGHSMGGCISRLLITDVGDRLWMKQFGTPPEKMAMSPDTKQILCDALIFKSRPEIGRVIFIAAPLQGADMASGWMGRLGSRLVKAPSEFNQMSQELVKLVSFQTGELKLNQMPNSVDTLAPNNRFVKNINTFPLPTNVPYHSIVGDRGKGGNKDHSSPVSSDGIVPYWSSHLAGARSELIVPSGHGAHVHPQAIAEVKRILRLHSQAK